jgi:Holliday junction resolvasome RuvABC ATP-dependent DNA helicase subunit
VFNPNLYGYPSEDTISTYRSSMFNAAEIAAMSRDIPYMATVLVKRIKSDPKVDLAKHWKVDL